ncbi:mask, partial [Symbiodinium sp. CCMP2456]
LTLPAEVVEELRDVRTLKQQLEKLCGQPRFRQKLLRDGVVLEETDILEVPSDLQHVILSFASSSAYEVFQFHEAAECGLTERVEDLLQRPLDPDSHHSHSPTPLGSACTEGHVEVVKLLLEAKAQPDMDFVNNIEQLISPICAAFYEVKRGDDREEIVKLLLDARADPSKRFGQAGKERTPLGVACERGCVKVVRSLLEARADVDCESAVVQVDRERLTIVQCFVSPLVLASRSGNVEIVRLLLEAAAHANDGRERGEALAVARDTGHAAIARLLTEACAAPDVQRCAAVFSYKTWGDR